MQNKRTPNQWVILGVVGMMLAFASFFVYLMIQKSSREEISASINSIEAASKSIEDQQQDELSRNESKIPENEEKLTALLENTNPNDTEGVQLIQNTINELLKTNDFKDIQPNILSALENNNLDIRIEGTNFLPKYPALHTPSTNGIKQLNVPLIIQTSPQWRSVPYGNTGSRQLYENGCAIVTLAMTQSYLDNRNITPVDILKWSGNHYYTPDGTSWQIFEDFTNHNGYRMENFGNNFYAAMEASKEGKLVIVSVGEGQFTEVGHFLIIRGYDSKNGLVYLNDANDDPKKAFSMQGVDESIVINEGLNY